MRTACREQLAQLIHNYGILTDELGRQDEDLVRLGHGLERRVRDARLRRLQHPESVARLPGTLRTTETTLAKVDLGQVLGPTLDDPRPAVRELDEANAEVPAARARGNAHRPRRDPAVRAAGSVRAVRDLKPTARNLSAALPDHHRVRRANRLFNMLAFNPAGADQAEVVNPVTGNSGDTNRGGESVESDQRDEGYLYWLAWVANNTASRCTLDLGRRGPTGASASRSTARP